MQLRDAKGSGEESVNFLLAEYELVNQRIAESEELGNTRVNYFLTLTTAVIGGSGIANIISAQHGNGIQINLTLTVALTALLAYGLITLARILHRNGITDELKRKSDQIRSFFVERDPTIRQFVAFDPAKQSPTRTAKWKHPFTVGSGGLVQTVALLNTFITVSLMGTFLSLILPTLFPQNPPIALLGALALVAFASWVVQWYYVLTQVRRKESEETSFKTQKVLKNASESSTGAMVQLWR